MTRRAVVLALCVAVVVSVGHAQVSGVVLPNGGWVPCDHPAAEGRCSSVPATPIADTAAPTVPPPTGVACDYVSPYADRPACVVGDYRIGHVYEFGPIDKGLVIGLSMASDGAEVVTVQWVYAPIILNGIVQPPPRQVWAFLNDGSPRPWEMRQR